MNKAPSTWISVFLRVLVPAKKHGDADPHDMELAFLLPHHSLPLRKSSAHIFPIISSCFWLPKLTTSTWTAQFIYILRCWTCHRVHLDLQLTHQYQKHSQIFNQKLNVYFLYYMKLPATDSCHLCKAVSRCQTRTLSCIVAKPTGLLSFHGDLDSTFPPF